MRFPFFEDASVGLDKGEGAVVLPRSWAQMAFAWAVWALVVLTLARPEWVGPPVERTEAARDVMLAVDISGSMATKDFAAPGNAASHGSDGVKSVLDGFIADRRDDRIGLIVFGGAPYVLVPFTRDTEAARALLATLAPGMAGQNTVLGDAIGLAIRSFEASKVEARILILLSDGSDTGSRMAGQGRRHRRAERRRHPHHRRRRSRGGRRREPRRRRRAPGDGRHHRRHLPPRRRHRRPRRDLRPDRRRRRARGRDQRRGARAPPVGAIPAAAAFALVFLAYAVMLVATRLRRASARGPGMTALAAFTFLRCWRCWRWRAPRRPSGSSCAAAAPARPELDIAPHLAALTIGREGRNRMSAPDLLIGAAMLLALAAAGPAWRPAPSPFVTETAPLVIALDLSPSMTGTDVAPSRLERAKQKIRDLIALRAGVRVALVAYAGTAHLVMPLTEDPTVLLPFLGKGLTPSSCSTGAAQLPRRWHWPRASSPRRTRPARSSSSPTASTPPTSPPSLAAGRLRRADRRPESPAPRSPNGRAAPASPPSPSPSTTATSGRSNAHWRRASPAPPPPPAQDDGWVLALPAAVLVLLWFRRGTTLRWGAMLLAALTLALRSPLRGPTGSPDCLTPTSRAGGSTARIATPRARRSSPTPGRRRAVSRREIRRGRRSARADPDRDGAIRPRHGAGARRDYPGAVAAFEAALALDPGDAAAAHNLDVTRRIIAYLTEAQTRTRKKALNRLDDTVEDLTGDQAADSGSTGPRSFPKTPPSNGCAPSRPSPPIS